MTFRARDWQIGLVFGLVFAFLILVIVDDLREIGIRRQTHKQWDLKALDLAFMSAIATIFICTAWNKFGSKVEIREGQIIKKSWRGKMLGSGRLDSITALGLRKTFWMPSYFLVSFGEEKPLKIDAEYHDFQGLVRAIEEVTGKKTQRLTWPD